MGGDEIDRMFDEVEDAGHKKKDNPDIDLRRMHHVKTKEIKTITTGFSQTRIPFLGSVLTQKEEKREGRVRWHLFKDERGLFYVKKEWEVPTCLDRTDADDQAAWYWDVCRGEIVGGPYSKEILEYTKEYIKKTGTSSDYAWCEKVKPIFRELKKKYGPIKFEKPHLIYTLFFSFYENKNEILLSGEVSSNSFWE